MSEQEEYQPTIRLDRDTRDYILPKGFFDTLAHRLLPVMSLAYLSAIILIALGSGDFLETVLSGRGAYMKGMFLVLWVSGPAIIWILMAGNPLLCHVATMWYKILSGLLVVTIAVSYALFPEAKLYGMKEYFLLSTPMFVLIYYIFIRRSVPLGVAYPLNAAGTCAVIWAVFMDTVL